MGWFSFLKVWETGSTKAMENAIQQVESSTMDLGERFSLRDGIKYNEERFRDRGSRSGRI